MPTAKPTKGAAKMAPVRKTPRKPAAAKTQSITPKAERFIEEYLIDLNGAQAYVRSHPGVKITTARVESARLLANPLVQERIAAARKKTSDRLEMTREVLLEQLSAIVLADPRELMEYVVTCCRHCHGIGFAFQWVHEAELRAAAAKAREEHREKLANLKGGEKPPVFVEPSDVGGFGFEAAANPHPHCPHCRGEGYGRTVFKDTRNLSAQAAALFAGVKETKDGLQILTHSKLDAIEKVAKHLGFYLEYNKQKAGSLGDLLGQLARSPLPGAAMPADEDDEE